MTSNNIKSKLDELMNDVKKTNPDASWSRFFVGLFILTVFMFISVWYFNLSFVLNSDDLLVDPAALKSKQVKDSVSTDPIEPSNSTGDMVDVIVQKGEGLWQVAKRICSDGENYKQIAIDNNLHINTALNEGMILKVKCN